MFPISRFSDPRTDNIFLRAVSEPEAAAWTERSQPETFYIQHPQPQCRMSRSVVRCLWETNMKIYNDEWSTSRRTTCLNVSVTFHSTKRQNIGGRISATCSRSSLPPDATSTGKNFLRALDVAVRWEASFADCGWFQSLPSPPNGLFFGRRKVLTHFSFYIFWKISFFFLPIGATVGDLKTKIKNVFGYYYITL